MTVLSHARADASALRVHNHADPFKGFAERFNTSRMRTAIMATEWGASARADAAPGLALARELDHLSAIVTQQPLPELTSTLAFPGVPDQPEPWKETYTVKDLRGAGGRVSHSYADKGDSANVIVSLNTPLPIVPYITHAGYNIDEIARAALGNIPLAAFKLMIARRMIEESVNQDVWFGNAALGLVGFYNAPGVTPAVVANGVNATPTWATKTGEEMLADFTEMVTTHQEKIKGLGFLSANVLRMSPASYTKAAVTLISNVVVGSARTVLSLMQEYGEALATGFKIEKSFELADNGSGSRWMSLYRYDGMVAGRIVAMPTTFLPPDVESLSTSMVAHAQAGGMCLRYPVGVEIRYGM